MAGIDVIGKIATPINNERGAIKDMIRRLTEISQVAIQAGGDIGKVVSANIQKTITDLNNIANGPDQSSLLSMIKYLQTVPLGTMFPLDLNDDITANNAPSVVTQAETTAPAQEAPAIDMTPHTENGPQSAIAANESVARSMLADYFKLKEASGIVTEDDEIPTENTGALNFKNLTESMNIQDLDDTDISGGQFMNKVPVSTPTAKFEESSDVIVGGQAAPVAPAASLNDWRAIFESTNSSSLGDLSSDTISDGLNIPD